MTAALKTWLPDGRLQFDSSGYHGLIVDTFVVTDGQAGSKRYDIVGARLTAVVLPMWPTFSGGLTGIPFIANTTAGLNTVSWNWPDWFGKGNPWYIPCRIIVLSRP